MPEKKLWKYLRDGMAGRWLAQRHEDSICPGIPDVSFATSVHGWLELKYVKIASDGIIKPNLSQVQRGWLKSYGRKAGNCFVLIQIDEIYVLYSWENIDFIDASNLEVLIKQSEMYWVDSIDFIELAICLGATYA